MGHSDASFNPIQQLDFFANFKCMIHKMKINDFSILAVLNDLYVTCGSQPDSEELCPADTASSLFCGAKGLIFPGLLFQRSHTVVGISLYFLLMTGKSKH